MFKIISFISSGSILLPLTTGIVSYKRFGEYFIKPFFLLIILSSFVEVLNVYFVIIGQNNQLIFNLYVIGYLLFILFVYKTEITKPVFIIGLITTISLFILLGLNPVAEINTMIFTITFGEMILFSVLILYKIYKKEPANIFEDPLFWIAFGTLLYCSCTLIVFSLSKYMSNKSNPVLVLYYLIYLSSINVITNSIYAYSFLCLKRKEKY